MRRASIVLVLAALAGCGGEEALSTDEYRAEAKKICADADRASDAVKPPTRTTNEAIADYFGRLLEVNRQTSDRFAELEPPDDLKSAHEEALAANRQGVDEVEKLVNELERGGDARALLQGAQGRLQEISTRSGRAAQRLGVPECAQQE